MNFYETLYDAIHTHTIERKEALTFQALSYCNQNKIIAPSPHHPKALTDPSYASLCTIVDPKVLPQRKAFHTVDGLATLVHAIAHIEYSAIDLALDAVYRYPNMPLDYKIDWLVVAQDEIRHYKMLHVLLEQLGYTYGDFPVHAGLFDAATHTAHSLLHRMAVIPRYYEASGLDVNPQIIKKLENQRNPMHHGQVVEQVIEALEVIYEEEIAHVTKGDRWFKYVCQEQGLDEVVYFEILEAYGLLEKHRPHINVEARKASGFTCKEIKRLGAKSCHS
jgi:uncharacterized ferritin-like protein (DUF455 family)